MITKLRMGSLSSDYSEISLETDSISSGNFH